MPDWASPHWSASKVQPNPEVIQIWGTGTPVERKISAVFAESLHARWRSTTMVMLSELLLLPLGSAGPAAAALNLCGKAIRDNITSGQGRWTQMKYVLRN